MKRRLAVAVYVAGSLFIAWGTWHVVSLPDGDASFWGRVVTIIIGIIGTWWIVAGVGIRLGVPPRQLVRSITAQRSDDVGGPGQSRSSEGVAGDAERPSYPHRTS